MSARCIDGRGWVRDTGTLTSGGYPCVVHLAGRDDETPVYRGRYEPDCSSCWLGHTHSEAKHEQALRV